VIKGLRPGFWDFLEPGLLFLRFFLFVTPYIIEMLLQRYGSRYIHAGVALPGEVLGGG
jgi:hypothetical protein